MTRNELRQTVFSATQAAGLLGIHYTDLCRQRQDGLLERPEQSIGGKMKYYSITQLIRMAGAIAKDQRDMIGLVRVDEAAALIGLGPEYFGRLCKQGKFEHPEYKLGQERYYTVAQIVRMQNGSTPKDRASPKPGGLYGVTAACAALRIGRSTLRTAMLAHPPAVKRGKMCYWTQEQIDAMKSEGIRPVFSQPFSIPGWYTQTDAAVVLGITHPTWVLWRSKGKIPGPTQLPPGRVTPAYTEEDIERLKVLVLELKPPVGCISPTDLARKWSICTSTLNKYVREKSLGIKRGQRCWLTSDDVKTLARHFNKSSDDLADDGKVIYNFYVASQGE